MKAPNRLFMNQRNISEAYPECSISKWFATDIEYICKDTLLEWVKDWQDELDDSLGASMVHHVLNEVIKKIESL